MRETANQFHVPVAAYSVSGEYAMIEAAANAGLVDRGHDLRNSRWHLSMQVQIF